MWYRSPIPPCYGHKATFTRHARALRIIALLLFMSATAAFGQPDILIRDCPADVGQAGNPQCFNVYWQSPDIWTRKAGDKQLGHEPPKAGHNYYVHFQLTNIGPDSLDSGEVYVYYGSASTSLSSWGVTPPKWNLIGSKQIIGLAPSTSIIEYVQWGPVPSNSMGDHYCLLVRFVSNEDSMQVPEDSVIYDNTRNNNNIAWRNLTTIHAPPSGDVAPAGSIDFYNGRDYPVITQLNFDMDQPGPELPEGLRVRLKLGPALYQKWVDGGRVGLTTGVADEIGTHSVVIHNVHESIGGINLNPNEAFPVEMEILYDSEYPPTPSMYNWVVSQWESGRTDPIGGIVYEIHMETGGAGKRVMRPDADLGAKLGLSAQPNMGAAAMTIGFTLPSDDRITLAIYDMNGRLVRTLLSGADQSAGAHAAEWDGRATDGTLAPSGTYIYRLSTGEGNAEGQLKIVR